MTRLPPKANWSIRGCGTLGEAKNCINKLRYYYLHLHGLHRMEHISHILIFHLQQQLQQPPISMHLSSSSINL